MSTVTLLTPRPAGRPACLTYTAIVDLPKSSCYSLAGRVVALVVVPGVLVAIAAVLWLLEKNHNKQVIILLCFVILYFTIVHPTFTIASVYFTLNNFQFYYVFGPQ